jgi:hypothetical protein
MAISHRTLLALVLTLPTATPDARCPSDCSGANGQCVNGVCFCADGFLPPDCSRPRECLRPPSTR